MRLFTALAVVGLFVDVVFQYYADRPGSLPDVAVATYVQAPPELQRAISPAVAVLTPSCGNITTDRSPGTSWSNPQVFYEKAYAIAYVGCDQKAAYLYVAQQNAWRQVAAVTPITFSQLQYACSVIQKYHVPIHLLEKAANDKTVMCTLSNGNSRTLNS